MSTSMPKNLKMIKGYPSYKGNSEASPSLAFKKAQYFAYICIIVDYAMIYPLFIHSIDDPVHHC